jgi:hypothetical protein
MTKARAASLALVTTAPARFDAMAPLASSRASNRRMHARLTPAELESPLSARLKYGEAVRLVDVSAGGALVETSILLRPDTDLVLEILDSRSRDVTEVVSRVLRSHVSGLKGGITYRGACEFKRPLSHPGLVAPPPLIETGAHDFLKLEFALKTIVEAYFRRPTASAAAGRWRDATALLDALVRLRAAAERRENPIDRQLAQLLATIIPALQRDDAVESVMGLLHDQLSRHLPLLAIRADRPDDAPAHDRERVTLNMCTEPGQPPVAVTAEFAAGFGLDESQFRLLKASAYLVGLVGGWRQPPPSPAPVATPPPAIDVSPEPEVADKQDLPVGWQRMVVRCGDGRLLRGYSNDFKPDRAHLHLSPTVGCAAASRMLVPIMRLKAVFFVKDLQGDPGRVDTNTFDHSPRGRKVEVTFRDGEVMIGSTLSYKPDGRGFFLQPANSQTNNIRIYVVTSAIRHMRFL